MYWKQFIHRSVACLKSESPSRSGNSSLHCKVRMSRLICVALLLLLASFSVTYCVDKKEGRLKIEERETVLLPHKYQSYGVASLLNSICKSVNDKCWCESIERQKKYHVSAFCVCVSILADISEGITCEIHRTMVWIPRPPLAEIWTDQWAHLGFQHDSEEIFILILLFPLIFSSSDPFINHSVREQVPSRFFPKPKIYNLKSIISVFILALIVRALLISPLL